MSMVVTVRGRAGIKIDEGRTGDTRGKRAHRRWQREGLFGELEGGHGGVGVVFTVELNAVPAIRRISTELSHGHVTIRSAPRIQARSGRPLTSQQFLSSAWIQPQVRTAQIAKANGLF